MLQEWKKIRRPDAFAGIVLLMFCMAAAIPCLSIHTVHMGDEFLPEQYLKAAEAISGMSADEAVEYLEKQEDEILETDLYVPENQIVLQEVSAVRDYPEYLSETQSGTSGGLEDISGNNFETRVRKKYQEKYKGLDGKGISFVAGRGIQLFLHTDYVDGIIGILLLLFIFRLVTMEYEGSMSGLLCCTKNGTKNILRVKWLLGAVLTLFTTVIILLIKLFLYAQAYHFSAWNRAIQCIDGYQSVEWQSGILGFLILFFIGKMIGFLFLYTMCFLAAVWLKNAWLFFIMLMAGGALAFYLLFGISLTSRLALLSLFCPFRLVDQEVLLSGYRAVNLFGYPVDYLKLFCVVWSVVFLAMLFSIWTRDMFAAGLTALEKPGKCLKSFSGFRRKRMIARNSLLLWELRKNLWLEKGFLLLVLGGVVAGTVYAPPEEYIVVREDYYYREYVEEYAGMYSEEKQEKIQDAYKQLQELEQDIIEHGALYTDVALAVANEELRKVQPMQRMIQYGKYLKNHENAGFVYEKGYLILLGKNIPGSYLRLCDVLAIFLMALLSVRMWGLESWQNMALLCRGMKYDMRRIDCRKWILNGCYALLAAGVVFPYWVYQVSLTYPLHEWNLSAASLQGYSAWSFLNLGSLVALTYLLRIVYLYLVGALGRILQRKLHSPILTVFTTVLVMILPLYIIQ